MPARSQSFLNSPVLLTHWDPETYPGHPLPLIPELVINLLAYGHVALKDVDLFMNERIVSYLTKDSVHWEAFASLIRTKRITVLTPDRSRGLDPGNPFLSAAQDHAARRTFAGRPWTKFDNARKAFCQKLDILCVPTGICRPRITPPEENLFAMLLRDILINPDKQWWERKQFGGITGPVEKQFVAFCEDPNEAIHFLERNEIEDIPHRNQGFYRTRLYQCAAVPSMGRARLALENLAQSVYAALETDRENVAGTYFGRLAECPNPYVTANDPSSVDIRIVPKRQKHPIQLMETADIGEIVEETLRETGSVMQAFWKHVGKAHNPEEEFKLAWMHVADEFARSTARHAAAPFRSAAHQRWHYISSVVHSVLLQYETGVMGFKFWLRHHPDELAQQVLDVADVVTDALILTADGITVGGERAEHWIRSGFVEAKMLPKSRDTLLDGATIRAARGVAPVQYRRVKASS